MTGFCVEKKDSPRNGEKGFFFKLRGIQACEFLGIYGSLHRIVQPGPQKYF